MKPATDKIFDNVIDPPNLFQSYKRARKGIVDKLEANIIEQNLEREIFRIRDQLIREEYEFGPYRTFMVRDPKERPIHVAPFRDRIVHHAINSVIEPIVERSFIADSYACRKGKGNLKALQRLQRWLNGDPSTYVLSMDISKFFASINRGILLRQIRKHIQDEILLRLPEELVMSAPSLLFPGKGLPIGNLTSQTLANLYLNDLDHFAKDYLGVRRYIRYVDDIICVGKKEDLHKIRIRMKDYLEKHLDLKIAPRKDKVLLARNGITYLGFVLRANQRPRLKHEAIKRFFWSLKRARRSGLPEEKIAMKVVSWYAYAGLANVEYLIQKADAGKYLEDIIKREKESGSSKGSSDRCSSRRQSQQSR